MIVIACKDILIAAGGLAFLRRMGRKLRLASIFWLGAWSSQGADLSIVSFDRNHNLSWNNVFSNAITTVETATSPTGPWRALKSFYDQGKSDKASLPPMEGNHFVRLLQADISATPEGFTSLVTAYGLLSTLAGNAGGTGVDGVNEWLPGFEGAPATDVILSRPHIAMADHAGNIFIADKDSHSILEITLDGRIHTVAGTHESGFNGDGPAPATSLQLSQPNGLHVHGDGSFHILDSGNNKVRRVDTNGIMTTLFSVSTAFQTGRGLYVKNDESVAYFCATTTVMKWTPTNGVTLLKAGFLDLGNLDLDSAGHLFVTDRGANKVYRISNSGNRTVVAGNGTKNGGGDGFPALQTGLLGVRGIWFLPNDGYLLATHEGSQIWYVDTAGIIHLLVDGQMAAHSGDGEWFRTPGFKVSQPRQVTMTDDGDLLITENDNGYIRKINFLRLTP